MNKDNIKFVLIFLFVLIIPFVIILSSASSTAFNRAFYKSEFSKYNPNVEEKEEISKNLIFYLKDKDSSENLIQNFTKEEISHLKDVKNLAQNSILLLNILMLIAAAIAGILFYLNKKEFLKEIGKAVIESGVLTIIILIAIYFFLSNFDSAFAGFHNLFFEEGTWTFPESSLLITLFPEQFWIDVSSRILFIAFISANILILVGVLLLIIFKKRNAGVKNVIH